MSHRRRRLRAPILLLSLALIAPAYAEPPTPPAQPATGPGGADYPHADVVQSVHGDGPDQYWIFEPANPRPATAPVVVFCHGWGATSPRAYGAWIRHLARKGSIVIFPRYQASALTTPATIVDSAIAAVHAALATLATPVAAPGTPHVTPDLERVAAVGHSAGGNLAASLAALARDKGLPRIRAAMCVEPGNSWLPPRFAIPLADPAKIPAGTLLVAVIGDEDQVTADRDARRIVGESALVAATDKALLELRSDGRGSPALRADHMAPAAYDPSIGAPGPETLAHLGDRLRKLLRPKDAPPTPVEEEQRGVDALDHHGCWRLFDALTDAAWSGKNRDLVLGDTPRVRAMGTWSDGEPVAPLVVHAPR